MINDAQALLQENANVRSHIADYVSLTKPELTFLSVLTALCGFYLASDVLDLGSFVSVGIGTLLLGGGAGTLNQYIERNYDGMMRRTERRPLPSGRVKPVNALRFGLVLSFMGIVILFVFSNVLTGLLGLLTIASYLLWYTPLKRISPHSTLVGGIPGALPPLIGWSAASGTITAGGWILFFILFFWQMPHFLSLAWMYRKDYARAGYRMLTVLDPDGGTTSLHILVHSVLLGGTSILLTFLGLTGSMYGIGAMILGVSFIGFSILFRWFAGTNTTLALTKTNQYSRYLFFASLLYLPALMFLMVVDKL
ncbi:MAG TPA: heme o synthase [Bacteroidota bacterium]|nr:heme o synthase [Bacteroidota bacterium]